MDACLAVWSADSAAREGPAGSTFGYGLKVDLHEIRGGSLTRVRPLPIVAPESPAQDLKARCQEGSPDISWTGTFPKLAREAGLDPNHL